MTREYRRHRHGDGYGRDFDSAYYSRSRRGPRGYGGRSWERRRYEMNPYESTYFGTLGMTHTTLKTTAIKSIDMLFFPDEYETNEDISPNSIPLGFGQVVLAIQDTQFMLSGSTEFWDRFRVRRIKFRYSPMGTEAIYQNLFITGGTTEYLYPPYSNGPLLITYDPTANVADANEALNVMTRFGTQQQIVGTDEFRVKYIIEGQRAMRQSQHYVGETTKTFKGNIVGPRAIMYTTTGSQGFFISSQIDVANQYKIQGSGVANVQDGEFVTTYGMLNFIIPRSTTGLFSMINPSNNQRVALPKIKMNVTITYYLELYGHT